MLWQNSTQTHTPHSPNQIACRLECVFVYRTATEWKNRPKWIYTNCCKISRFSAISMLAVDFTPLNVYMAMWFLHNCHIDGSFGSACCIYRNETRGKKKKKILLHFSNGSSYSLWKMNSLSRLEGSYPVTKLAFYVSITKSS